MSSPPFKPRIVAHRGASFVAPENTLAAFRQAWRDGAEAVELDVRVTKDGHVVVFHDDNTVRITGVDRPLADQTLAELRAHDAGAWKGAAFTGERIPTLAEALATVPAGRTLFVEIKSGPETAAAVAAVIRATQVRIAVQGYGAEALAALAKELPGVDAYLDIDPPDGQHYPVTIIADTKQRGFAGLALDYRGVTDEFLAAASAEGMLMDVWTLNDRALIARWQTREVRWLETDRPDIAP